MYRNVPPTRRRYVMSLAQERRLSLSADGVCGLLADDKARASQGDPSPNAVSTDRQSLPVLHLLSHFQKKRS